MTTRAAAVMLLAAYVAALAFAVKAAAKLPPATLAFWDRVARCETGGNWQMSGPTYSGGTGMANTTYRWWARELGLLGRYSSAAVAPRLVQIRVSDYGYRRYHGYWGTIANGCAGRYPG